MNTSHFKRGHLLAADSSHVSRPSAGDTTPNGSYTGNSGFVQTVSRYNAGQGTHVNSTENLHMLNSLPVNSEEHGLVEDAQYTEQISD